MKISRYVFAIFNCLFLLLSLVLVILGVVLLVTLGQGKSLGKEVDDFSEWVQTMGLESSFQILGIICIALGVFTFVASLLGLIGALQDSRCTLGTYIFLMVILIFAELGTIIYILTSGRDNFLTDTAVSHFENQYSKDNVTIAVQLRDQIMYKGKCCGIKSWKQFNDTKVPCCQLETLTEADKLVNASMTLPPPPPGSDCSEFTEGCFDKYYHDLVPYIIGGAGAAGGLELIALVLAVLVYRAAYYDFM